jgi:hypothetical protein
MGWFGDTLDGIGGAVKDVGGAVGDVINEVADAAEDIGGAGDWLANQACALDNSYVCGIGSFFGGAFSAGFSALGGSLHGASQFTEGILSAAGNGLQGRWKDTFDDLGSATLGGLLSAWEGVTVVPRIADETVRNWQRNQLRGFASDLINDKYKDDPQRREDARRIAGVDNRNPWGMQVLANYRCLEFSSFDLDLKSLHDDQSIPLDLYQLAGYRSASDGFFPAAPTAEVFALRGPDSVPAEGDFASRDQIDSYLSRGTPGLLIRSVNSRNGERSMAYAKKVARDVGMHLSWNNSTTRVTQEEMDNPEMFPLIWRAPDFARANHSEFLNGRGYRDNASPASECHIEAFGVLWPCESLSEIKRGITLGLFIDEYPQSACVTVGRDDNCCTTIYTDATAGTSVSFMWPRNAGARATNRFILAHEIGHWMGLCHPGHVEATQIMYTGKGRAVGWAMFARGLQHPRFTGKDGRNIWRFTVDQRLDLCVGGVREPVPVE